MQAEVAAQKLLENTWLSRHQDDPFPVDPIAIAKVLGIKVFEAGLPDEVSGLLVKHPGKDPEIHLQMNDSLNRRRFTCAHELGHYVARSSASDFDDSEWGYVDRRSPLTAEGIEPGEIFANQFAAALLMPRDAVMSLVHDNENAVMMAVGFGVSSDAMNFRLDNLRLKAT